MHCVSRSKHTKTKTKTKYYYLGTLDNSWNKGVKLNLAKIVDQKKTKLIKYRITSYNTSLENKFKADCDRYNVYNKEELIEKFNILIKARLDTDQKQKLTKISNKASTNTSNKASTNISNKASTNTSNKASTNIKTNYMYTSDIDAYTIFVSDISFYNTCGSDSCM